MPYGSNSVRRSLICGEIILRSIMTESSMFESTNMNTYFSGETPSMDEIRQKLSKYTGGEISCLKNNDGIAKICINHPQRKNAISGKMMTDLEKIVEDLQKWENGKGVLMYGADEIFCSGGDLNFARQENNPQSGFEMATFMINVLQKLSNLPLISVAYVHGYGAIGGGAELLTACDYRICNSNPKTRIGFVHSKMGIVPAWGGTSRLVNIVGKTKALDLILSGESVFSKECLDIGLANHIVNTFEEAYSWLLKKVSADVSVVRATKACVSNATQISENVLENEKRLFAPLWGGPANKRALEQNIKHK